MRQRRVGYGIVTSARCPSLWLKCSLDKNNSLTTAGHFVFTACGRPSLNRCIQASRPPVFRKNPTRRLRGEPSTVEQLTARPPDRRRNAGQLRKRPIQRRRGLHNRRMIESEDLLAHESRPMPARDHRPGGAMKRIPLHRLPLPTGDSRCRLRPDLMAPRRGDRKISRHHLGGAQVLFDQALGVVQVADP